MNRSYLLGLALAFVGAFVSPASADEQPSSGAAILKDRGIKIGPPAQVIPVAQFIPLGDPPARKDWHSWIDPEDAEVKNHGGFPLQVKIKNAGIAGTEEIESLLQPLPDMVRVWVDVHFQGYLWWGFQQGEWAGYGLPALIPAPGYYVLIYDVKEAMLQEFDHCQMWVSDKSGAYFEVEAIDFLEKGADDWTRWQEFVEPTSVGGEVPSSILTVELGQNAPNPFNPVTTIPFTLARDGSVRLNVFDVSGSHVVRLVDGELTAGLHHVTWNGTNTHGTSIPSGVYAYQLVTNEGTITRSMILVK